jgi:hypothetical protein
MRKLVLLWLDAFSDRYLTPELSPFLWNLSKKCFFVKIKPLFAYKGIEYCFEYGTPLNELGVWNNHVFAGFEALNKRQNSLFKKTLKFVDKISPSDEWNKIFRYLLFKLARIDYGTPHLIPPEYIDVFPVPKLSFNRKSLYQILNENYVKYLKKEPKLTISEGALIKYIPKFLMKYDAVFLKLNSLDRLGHKYGPLSNKVKKRVKYFDRLIGELFPKIGKNVTLIIMSDHGMTPVTHHFDLIGFLTKKGFKFGNHYIAFVGATYASFWFKNEQYKEKIVNELTHLKVGQLLSINDKIKLGINEIGMNFYGEEIFAAKEHHVFFPEFYHVRRQPKGMHGYASNTYDTPLFLLYGDVTIKLKRNRIDFVNMLPIVLELLDLRYYNV